MIRYVYNIEDLKSEQLSGFFVGWLNKPDPETHLEILKKSTYVVWALNDETERNTEDFDIRNKMMQNRMSKLEDTEADYLQPVFTGDEDFKYLLVG